MSSPFSQALGHWHGTAEVYDGRGRVLGNATDQRHVQDLGQGRVRIDVAFIGPLKFAGHYFIQNDGAHRHYEGPANYGFAETLADNLVDANAYWPLTGLSQRFCLMVLPGGARQLSLSLMYRGEELLYAIVGENTKVLNDAAAALPDLMPGTSYDLADDPSAGRGQILLHRTGIWSGALNVLNEQLQHAGTTHYREIVTGTGSFQVTLQNNAFAPDATFALLSNGWQAWTPAGDVVGSYSLSGGRALSGQFYFPTSHTRLWRREIVSHDGTQKAVLHVAYQGGQRVGVQFGVLDFNRASSL